MNAHTCKLVMIDASSCPFESLDYRLKWFLTSSALLPTVTIAFFNSSGVTPELLRPIPQFVIFFYIDPRAVLATWFAFIVGHSLLVGRASLESPPTRNIGQ